MGTVPESLQRVMAVEDDESILAILEFSLQSVGGLDICLCASGREALARAEEFDPQLFLLDVMIPEMDGPTTLAALRQRDGMSEVPAVYLTARVLPAEQASLRTPGVLEVLSKPFDPVKLPEQLRALWRRAQD